MRIKLNNIRTKMSIGALIRKNVSIVMRFYGNSPNSNVYHFAKFACGNDQT